MRLFGALVVIFGVCQRSIFTLFFCLFSLPLRFLTEFDTADAQCGAGNSSVQQTAAAATTTDGPAKHSTASGTAAAN